MYQRILAVVDDRAACASAVREAIQMATVHHAELLLFYVLAPMNAYGVEFATIAVGMDEQFAREARTQASRRLHDMAALAEASGVRSQRAMGQGFDDAACVAEAAAKRQCDVVVVAADQRNAVMRILGGSIVPGLITRSKVPVLVVKDERSEPRQRLWTRAPRRWPDARI